MNIRHMGRATVLVVDLIRSCKMYKNQLVFIHFNVLENYKNLLAIITCEYELLFLVSKSIFKYSFKKQCIVVVDTLIYVQGQLL